MPVFSLDIEKRLGTEFWTNRYILEATDIAQAVALGLNITGAEQTFHGTPVTFTRYRVSNLGEGNEQYTIVPLNLQGVRAVSQLLPLFNTLRMDFPAPTGRPSRKFYRGVLDETDINGSAVGTDFSSAANAISAQLKASSEFPGIIDPQGAILGDAVVYPFVQMRQLRRSRRRRLLGGIFP